MPRMQNNASDLEAPYRSGERVLSEPADEPLHPGSAVLLQFWRSRNCGELPKRSQIACRELKAILPFLFLMQPVDSELNEWRYRLIGSSIMERLGMSRARGCLMSELHQPEVVELRRRAYREIAQTKQPRISRGRIVGIGRDFYRIEGVHVPIDGGGANPTWILAGMFFFN